jgi:hypothetical protein
MIMSHLQIVQQKQIMRTNLVFYTYFLFFTSLENLINFILVISN